MYIKKCIVNVSSSFIWGLYEVEDGLTTRIPPDTVFTEKKAFFLLKEIINNRIVSSWKMGQRQKGHFVQRPSIFLRQVLYGRTLTQCIFNDFKLIPHNYVNIKENI